MNKNILVIVLGVCVIAVLASLALTYSLYQEVRSEQAVLETAREQTQAKEESRQNNEGETLILNGNVQTINEASQAVVIQGGDFGETTFSYNSDTLFFAESQSISGAADEGPEEAEMFFYNTMEEFPLGVGDSVEITFAASDQGSNRSAIQITKQ
ncbi:MAG: hypothetical protein U5L75_03465 [Candidatus Campbellbacteria bacterium]|nr:hypothetical protein [Candidatus Campbellbacteria bacterium]